jgi:hypothetical protein
MVRPAGAGGGGDWPGAHVEPPEDRSRHAIEPPAENRANGFQAVLAHAYRLAKQASDALARYHQPGRPQDGSETAEAAMAD